MEQQYSTAIAHAPKPGRRKITVALYLDPDLVAQIDAYARASKASRSWVWERIAEGFLANQEEAAE
jgi:predicted transcriptional regulator